jgi:ribonuclease HI
MNDTSVTNDPQHRLRTDCSCDTCSHIRDKTYCRNPHKCIEMAKRIMATLPAKWNPNHPTPHNVLYLTPRRRARNKSTESNNDPILFDPNIEVDNPADCIRIFANNPLQNADPPHRDDSHVGNTMTTVYTDGSCSQTRQTNARAGSGIWFGRDDTRNRALRVPGKIQTNQRAEIYAVLQLIKTTPTNIPLLIKTDSYYVIKALTRHLKDMEDKGWLTTTNGDLIRTTVAWLRARQSPTALQWVKGHNNEEGNEEADRLAAEGATHPPINHLELAAPYGLVYSGSKLSAMTQKNIYLGIKATKLPQDRPAAMGMLDISKGAIKDMTNKSPTEEAIWQSLHNKDLSRPLRYFLWKCMHKVHKIGNFWDHIPNKEHYSQCPTCRVEETMEHILLDCTAPGQAAVWHLAKTLWTLKGKEWPTVSFGTILSCGSTKILRDEYNKWDNRLFRILVSESAYFIWKLRCERRISMGDSPEAQHTGHEIHNRWLHVINSKLTMERLLMDTGNRSAESVDDRVPNSDHILSERFGHFQGLFLVNFERQNFFEYRFAQYVGKNYWICVITDSQR